MNLNTKIDHHFLSNDDWKRCTDYTTNKIKNLIICFPAVGAEERYLENLIEESKLQPTQSNADLVLFQVWSRSVFQ